MYMVFCVLDDLNHLDGVLDGWTKLGVPGVTIIESSGLRRHQRQYLPMRYLFGSQEPAEGNVTLFALVADQAAVQGCLAAVEQVTGDLSQPNTGVFASWPVGLAKGLGGPPAPGGAAP